MDLLRKFLFPFAFLYGLITDIRNLLYDKQLLTSETFRIPIIAVGNLSVGGTGKSPQIEYLIRLLSPNYKIATLSRGYKRKSEGFIIADENATAETLGDEPYQFHTKFPNILVAVDADRRNGITQLLEHKPDVILLDDAYQHRKVKAGFYILLTAYNDLYADDYMLPAGNLRENRKGAKRADVVIVTKCPKDLSKAEQQKIKSKLKLNEKQQLFFTFVDYDDKVYSATETIDTSIMKNTEKIVIAGIAKPKPFFAYLRNDRDMILEFPDHHDFTQAEISSIVEKANGKSIITTEKDYVRLKSHNISNLYYLPIRSSFVSNTEDFNKIILDYVGKSTTNRSIH